MCDFIIKVHTCSFTVDGFWGAGFFYRVLFYSILLGEGGCEWWNGWMDRWMNDGRLGLGCWVCWFEGR